MFKTRVTELFGIKYPILAGPMAYLSKAEFVAAISNAGGLGILVSVSLPGPKELREEIRKTKSLTDKPFAVNVTLLPTIRPINYEAYFAAAIEEGVNIIETSGRSPEPYMKMLKDAGVKIMHRATRTRDIKTAERVGVDAVTIIGYEATGVIGLEDVTSMVRIPVAADEIKVPVIAAGGIADARGFVAALALGAEGVLMGTRFMASKECNIHQNIKEQMLQLHENDTIVVNRAINTPRRCARSEYVEKLLEMETKGATLEEILPMVRGDRAARSYTTGDTSDAMIPISQAVGLIHEIPSVKDIIEEIISQSKPVMQRLKKMGVG
ncbi:MAG: nitronate monooxygenase [Dehalococcoidales bacterium]|nr:nitronate monooxygenase [Dehalococcoidales bacterium]